MESKDNRVEEFESPYCKICSGCGEDGCCSALHCEQSPDGDYCKTYLNDLKFGYLMYKDLYHYLKDDEESKKKIDQIFDENYDFIYNGIVVPKTAEEFNKKYKDYIEEGHYGLALDKREVIEYLDKEFRELIKINGFKFSQIKSKFNSFRFYAEPVSAEKQNEIEAKIKELYNG